MGEILASHIYAINLVLTLVYSTASNMSLLLSGIFYLSSFVPRILDPSAPSGNTGEADVGGQSFDYIVVGGGLTGLTVANRLSEDASRKFVEWERRNCLTVSQVPCL